MNIEKISTLLFAIAVLHTFLAPLFNKMAKKYPEGSILENLFHLLGEVEVIFGLWAAVLFILYSISLNLNESVSFIESLNFTEPLFVFVIMAVAGTAPILIYAEKLLLMIVSLVNRKIQSFFLYTLILSVGTLLGSLITEPAAMTVCALLIKDIFLKEKRSERFLYLTLAILFVNISIGGTLTHFAAPPIVMVARIWNWDLQYVFQNFGVKFFEAIILNSIMASLLLKKELSRIEIKKENAVKAAFEVPFWVFALNAIFVGLVVFFSHHPTIFIAVFLFFLGVVKVTSEFHRPLPLRQALLVGFFLSGLVVLGKMQGWWLEPFVKSLGDQALYFGATALTAVTDNAALTYLGSLIPSLSESAKQALVAGAVTGGGLTVIANAPNPVGFAFLGSAFGTEGISALKLFKYALLPTGIAAVCYMFF